jgi:hypothetical protein
MREPTDERAAAAGGRGRAGMAGNLRAGGPAPAVTRLGPEPAPTRPASTCAPTGGTGGAHPGGVSGCHVVHDQYRAPYNGELMTQVHSASRVRGSQNDTRMVGQNKGGGGLVRSRCNADYREVIMRS